MLFVFIRENFKEISKLYFYDSTNIHMSGVINHRIFLTYFVPYRIMHQTSDSRIQKRSEKGKGFFV